MKGDTLASGGRNAKFQVGGEGEFIHDLKTLAAADFVTKYKIGQDEYSELITALRAGAKIAVMPAPIAQGYGKLAQAPEPTPIKATVRIPTKPEYEADAKGDNLLVIRVDREHSSQLIIPESAKAKSDVGRVAEAGPEVKRAKKGELVLFDRFAAHGKEIELVDEQGVPRQHLILNDVDILLGLKRFIRKPEAASGSSEPSPSETEAPQKEQG